MSPAAAQRMAQHARRLLTARILTPHDYAVLDALLWRLRRHGRQDLTATYSTIARLAGVARSSAIASVRRLVEIGLLSKLTRRVMVRWGRGQMASRQAANGYVFRVIGTESATPPVDKEIGRIQKESLLDRALQRLGEAAGFRCLS